MMELRDTNILPDGKINLSFAVTHNSETLPTTVENNLHVVAEPASGAVLCSLHLADLPAENLEAAREKMADWCERTAIALRSVERVQDAVLPSYRQKRFNKDELAPWLRKEFARIVNDLLELCPERRLTYRDELVGQGHPLIGIPGAWNGLIKSAEEAA